MPPDTIPAADAPQRCLHILSPGQAHCLKCGKQILFVGGFERTRLQRFTARVRGWVAFLMADNDSTTLPARRADGADSQA
jgi:hypothetical protein